MPVEEVLGGGVAPAGRVGVDGRQQRPAAGRLGRTGAGGHPAGGAGAGWWAAAAVGGGAGPGECAERGERVVADAPGPDEVPQGGGQGAVAGGADRLRQLTEEPRASGGERIEHGLVELGVLERLVLRQGQRRLLGQVERHPSVGPGQRRMTGPQHLAGAGELVEEGGLVVAHPRRQHEGLERGRRHRAPGELVDDREHAVDPAGTTAGGGDVLPGTEEPGERLGLDRLDLLAQPGQGPAPQLAQHLGVAPLRARPGRAELTVEHPPLRGQPLQGVADDGRAEAQPAGHLVGGERAVGAGVAGDQVGQGVRDRLAEDVGGAGRDGYAEPVAEPPDVLDGGPSLLAGDPDLDDPALVGERGQPAVDLRDLGGPRPDLVGRERPEEPQQVGHALGVVDAAVRREPLELGLDLGQDLGIEQLAQLGPAEQLGQQALVERQRGGPALGDRGVALVDELCDVPEQQAAGVRRRLGGRDVDDLHLAALDLPHQPDQRRQVVDVLEALADRLEHDREGRVLRRHLEQRRPTAGAAARGVTGGRGRAAGAAAHGPRTRGSVPRTVRTRRPRR